LIEFLRPWALALLGLHLPLYLWWRGSLADLPRERRLASLLVRMGILTLVVLALAGLRRVAPSDRLTVVFCVDRSLSAAPESQAWAEDYINRATARAGPGDSFAVVVFGRDAVVERAAAPRRPGETVRLRSVVDRQGTDLAAALRLALAAAPADSSCRIVLLSDGNATSGDALTEARLAASLGAEVWTVPLPARQGPEVLVESLEVPPHPEAGMPFDLRVVLEASQPTRGVLVLVRNGAEVARLYLELEAGKNVFLLPQRLPETGAFLYTAHFQAEADGHPENNKASGLALVGDPSRILFAIPEGGRPGPLPDLLRAQGLEVDTVAAGGLPASLVGWQKYQAVIFSDLPAYQISPRQMEWLRALVRETGMGFAMLGGPGSFGAGGYFRTPLEEVLPVDLDIRKRRHPVAVALELLIDKSGSMGYDEGGLDKMALAREAAIAACELLSSADYVGVCGFDSAARWVVRLQKVGDTAGVASGIATLRAGGGTNLYPALAQALEDLARCPAPVKHVIVLTDGMVEPGDYQRLTRLARQRRITISTVAIGRDADLAFLKRLADETGGRAYYSDRASALPRIFVRETVVAARAAFKEEPFRAEVAGSHSVLRGVDVEEAPPLLGWDLATMRPAPAQMVLAAPEGDPLLALGRAGLGKTAAWTSDAGGRWAREWARWSGFAEMMAQVVRWILPEGEASGLQVELENLGGSLLGVRVQVADAGEDLQIEGRAVSPRGQVRPLSLVPTAPGVYEGRLEADLAGPWLVGVGDGRRSGTRTFIVPYSPEFARLSPDKASLARLARAGRGRAEADAAQVFEPMARPLRLARDRWPALLLLALALFPLDVALRRVFLPEGWLDRARARLSRRAAPAAGARDPTLAALKMRKEQVRQRATPRPAPPGATDAPSGSPPAAQAPPGAPGASPAPAPAAQAPSGAPGASPAPAPAAQAPPGAPPGPASLPQAPSGAPGQTTMDRLKHARRRAREGR
jgi:uncharacterized membrane protein